MQENTAKQQIAQEANMVKNELPNKLNNSKRKRNKHNKPQYVL